MAQNTIDFSQDYSGDQLLDTLLTNWRANLESLHRGSSRPSYAIAGTLWINSTTNPVILNYYDGAADIKIGEIDETANIFYPYSSFLSSAIAVARDSSDTSKQVRFDLSALTTSTTRVITIPDQNITLGESAESGRNRIINGVAPFVNKRGAQTSMADGDYFADMWGVLKSGAMVFDGDVVTSGGEDWLELDITTIDASIAAGDYFGLGQVIEANNVTDFKLGDSGAVTITVQFKHKHTKTGTYCAVLRNSASDRSYVFEYTQTTTDTEETHTETIALDTAGTWVTEGIGHGLSLLFMGAVGSTYQTTKDAWQAGDYFGTSSQVNAADTVGNKLRIRDVQIEQGSSATTPERIDWSTKLLKCDRYYKQKQAVDTRTMFGAGLSTAGTNSQHHIEFAEMRTSPSISNSAASNFNTTNGNGSAINCTALSWGSTFISPFSARVVTTVSSGLTAGQAAIFEANNTNALIEFDAGLAIK